MNKKGVSLAEVLAVIVISGIFAAVAYPIFSTSLNDSSASSVENDAKEVLKAVNTYCTRNPEDGFCFGDSTMYTGDNDSLDLKNTTYYNKISDYLAVDLNNQRSNGNDYYTVAKLRILKHETSGVYDYKYFVLDLYYDSEDTPSDLTDDTQINNYSLMTYNASDDSGVIDIS